MSFEDESSLSSFFSTPDMPFPSKSTFPIICAARDFPGYFLIKLSYLSMDNNYWITNPISFEWVETSQDDNPFKNINPVNILSDIFSEIENPAIISSQNYDYEISADINSENLKSLVGDIIVTNKNVRLSLNINQDGIVDSIKIYGIVQPNDSIDTQREIKFERWNENLKWETP